jgi:hypothetical protein
MRKFEGNINGKVYTDVKEFNKALLRMDDSAEDICVSYRYISVPDSNEMPKLNKAIKNEVECNKNCVSENQYVKNITDKKDVEIGEELENAIKNASNKSDIRDVVNKKITYFDNKISNNILHIDDLRSDYKNLEDKMEIVNKQIKTLVNANNTYCLNKEYYKNINNLLDSDVSSSEVKGECVCDSCKSVDENTDTISFEDIYCMTPHEFTEYLKKMKICNLADLVKYFINN